jgi:hypothetical protein
MNNQEGIARCGILLVWPAPSRAADGEAAVAAAVRSFYTFHLAHDMGFSAQTLALRERWLSPGLQKLCREYLARPASPDDVPDVDGDPFTDSQEYPASWRMEGAPRIAGGRATVGVRFSGGGGRPHKLKVELVRQGDAWLIDDVVYESGPPLRGLLTAAPPSK